MPRRILILLLLIPFAAGVYAQHHHTRIVRPLKKIHSDTIAIPEDMIFHSYDDSIPLLSEPPTPEVEKTHRESRRHPKPKSNHSAATETQNTSGNVTILGEPQLTPEQMTAFVLTRNPSFNPEIAQAYYDVGKKYGIRGDIALCQAILETGWFKFTGGTAVTLDQNNFCGLGVTKLGVKGHSFDTVEQGVTAQLQHLYAYATKARLPEGEKIVDPRFNMVTRGVAPRWADLNHRWAANDHYAARIIALYDEMVRYSAQSH